MNPNRHALIDERLRCMHSAIARKIEANPALLEKARKNVERELGRCSQNSELYFKQWKDILDGPMENTLMALSGRGERETALRQSSPFYGFLSPLERWDIVRQFHERYASRQVASP